MKGSKKLLVVFALMAGISASQVFGFGIGAQGGLGNFGPGGQLTFQLDKSPVVFALGAYADSDALSVSLSGDWWIANPVIAGERSWSVNWFLGIGLGGWVTLGDDFALGAQARLPIGLNLYVLDKHLELFVQGVPHIGLSISPFAIPGGGWWTANMGFRVWTKPPSIGGGKR